MCHLCNRSKAKSFLAPVTDSSGFAVGKMELDRGVGRRNHGRLGRKYYGRNAHYHYDWKTWKRQKVRKQWQRHQM